MKKFITPTIVTFALGSAIYFSKTRPQYEVDPCPPPDLPQPPPHEPEPDDDGERPRLPVVNQCDRDIWIALGRAPVARKLAELNPHAENARLSTNGSIDFVVGDGPIPGVRLWAKYGCDKYGTDCDIGEDVPNQYGECPDGGCHPPIDTKFEITFGDLKNCRDGGGDCRDHYNMSFVDGFTLPMKVTVFGPEAGVGSCQSIDCGQLTASTCPEHSPVLERYTNGRGDLSVRNKGKLVGCTSPCKFLTDPRFGIGMPISQFPANAACCTPPYHLAPECREGLIEDTAYVHRTRNVCSSYAHPYDDDLALKSCPAGHDFEVVFCPNE